MQELPNWNQITLDQGSLNSCIAVSLRYMLQFELSRQGLNNSLPLLFQDPNFQINFVYDEPAHRTTFGEVSGQISAALSPVQGSENAKEYFSKISTPSFKTIGIRHKFICHELRAGRPVAIPLPGRFYLGPTYQDWGYHIVPVIRAGRGWFEILNRNSPTVSEERRTFTIKGLKKHYKLYPEDHGGMDLAFFIN